jgi:hypothetical protein
LLIREYTPADLDALRRMHASQGFDYAFPDLSDPIFISKLIVEDESGRPVMASLARLTCEMYLLIDRAGPRSAGILPANLTFADNPKIRQQDAHAAACGAGPLMWSAGACSRCSPTELAPSLSVSANKQPAGDKPRSSPGEHGSSTSGQARTADSGSKLPHSTAFAERQRWAQLLALHRAGEQDLLARGLDDAHAWLHPQIARRFGRRLESLGWLRDDTWTPYCRRLTSP